LLIHPVGKLAFVIALLLTLAAACPAQSLDGPVRIARTAPTASSLHLQQSDATDADAAATVAVYNDNDPGSQQLARKYAALRNLPSENIVCVSCTTGETISREDYDKTIAEPLRKSFIKNGWWRMTVGRDGVRVTASKIRFVALIRGIPLKIAPTAAYPGDKFDTVQPAAVASHNEAAVDSELALLGTFTRQISGVLPNPYYRSFAPIADLPMPELLLVCRLDAAYPRTVIAMMEDSVRVEKTGLWGFAYVDARGIKEGGFLQGDQWLRRARADAIKHGIPCIFDDQPALFPEHYPMRNAALYFGWYSEQVEGVFKNEKLRFVPGAVAVHIHSFSADSMRLPLRNWCAPLLERGAAATIGNVYEPYLTCTANLDIFEERLRSGLTFAEAAYASTQFLSWMTTFIGDPLYRPFKVQQDVTADPPGGPAAEWAAYREGVGIWNINRAKGEAALKAKATAMRSGIIMEGLGCLQEWAGDPESAIRSWAQGSQYFENEEDQVRCVLHAVETRRTAGDIARALGLARQQIRAHPGADATNVLRMIETQLTAPPISGGSATAAKHP